MSDTRKLFESFQKHLNEGSDLNKDNINIADFNIQKNLYSGTYKTTVDSKYKKELQDLNFKYYIHSDAESGPYADDPDYLDVYVTEDRLQDLINFITEINLKNENKYKNKYIKESVLNEEGDSLEDVRKDSKEKGLLTEDYIPSDTQLYMNTWGNYNNYGADVESINGGWMDLEQAKEFLEAHSEEEPFINDVENCPIEVSEYDNPWQVIEKLEYIENCDNKDAFLAILDDQNDNFEEAQRILEDGDYVFFPGVSTDEELGKAYVDMVGIDGVSNIENYLDREQIKQEIIEYLEDSGENTDDISDETLEFMVDEDIQTAEGNSDYFEKYFDYEALGRDLDYEGYYFADTGAIQTM